MSDERYDDCGFTRPTMREVMHYSRVWMADDGKHYEVRWGMAIDSGHKWLLRRVEGFYNYHAVAENEDIRVIEGLVKALGGVKP